MNDADSRPAVVGQVERPVRPLLERLRDVERDGMTFAGEAADEIEALRSAIEEWQVMALSERRLGEMAERERWATAARLVVEATPEQLPMALDALADVLRA